LKKASPGETGDWERTKRRGPLEQEAPIGESVRKQPAVGEKRTSQGGGVREGILWGISTKKWALPAEGSFSFEKLI